MLLYYIVVILGSVPAIANLIQPEANGVFFILVANPKFWFLLIVGPFICLLPDITIVIFKRMYLKTPADLIAECEKLKIPVPLKADSPTRTKANYEIGEWLKPDPNSKAKIDESEFENINDVTPDDNGFLKTGKDEISYNKPYNDIGYLSKAKPVKKKLNDETTNANEESNIVFKNNFRQRKLDSKFDDVTQMNNNDDEGRAKKEKKKKKKKPKHTKETDHTVTVNKSVKRKERKGKKKHKKEKEDLEG